MPGPDTCLACERLDPEHRLRRYGDDDIPFSADCWSDHGDDTLGETLLAEHQLLTPAVVAELEALFYDQTEPVDRVGEPLGRWWRAGWRTDHRGADRPNQATPRRGVHLRRAGQPPHQAASRASRKAGGIRVWSVAKNEADG